MNYLPLSGLRVLVTRPRDQASVLAQGIERAGGVAILFPLLDIAPVADTQLLGEQISRLKQFDLAIFISPNAVQYGMAAIAAAHAVLPPQVATIGLSSARALHRAGVGSVISPTERSDSEGLLALPELAQMAGRRVIIFRGDGGRELLADTLRARGATVEYASCYQRSKARQGIEGLLRERPDIITVTSSEALAHLREMLADSTTMLSTPLFVPHSRIAELATSQGWTEVVLTAAGDDGLLASLIAWRNTRGAR
ncbi:MAG: uroporphyrinogen-III synthase [Gallionella sp.]|nr:uroporphyrinogen-III synthase [Gallionella sp.]